MSAGIAKMAKTDQATVEEVSPVDVDVCVVVVAVEAVGAEVVELVTTIMVREVTILTRTQLSTTKALLQPLVGSPPLTKDLLNTARLLLLLKLTCSSKAMVKLVCHRDRKDLKIRPTSTGS